MVAKVLHRPTLILNRNWQPVNVATVARALVLVWNETARVVDPADYQLYTCQYCGAQPGGEELTLDHVVPRSQGGVSSWENCVLACVACNKRKADRTPEQARMHLRRKPVRPTWKPLYADHEVRIKSWSKFISEAYWNVTLQE